MKLHFDPDLDYQLAAIESVTDLFKGQPLDGANAPFPIREKGRLALLSGLGNRLVVSQAQILENLRAVQKRNGITESESLKGMNFSIDGGPLKVGLKTAGSARG